MASLEESFIFQDNLNFLVIQCREGQG